jgi:hypothetical protein
MFIMMTIMNMFNSFSEVVFVWWPWQFATLGYNLLRIGAFAPITTSIGFQNQPSHTNIHLVPINLEMEWFRLLNILEKVRHID